MRVWASSLFASSQYTSSAQPLASVGVGHEKKKKEKQSARPVPRPAPFNNPPRARFGPLSPTWQPRGHTQSSHVHNRWHGGERDGGCVRDREAPVGGGARQSATAPSGAPITVYLNRDGLAPGKHYWSSPSRQATRAREGCSRCAFAFAELLDGALTGLDHGNCQHNVTYFPDQVNAVDGSPPPWAATPAAMATRPR